MIYRNLTTSEKFEYFKQDTIITACLIIAVPVCLQYFGNLIADMILAICGASIFVMIMKIIAEASIDHIRQVSLTEFEDRILIDRQVVTIQGLPEGYFYEIEDLDGFESTEQTFEIVQDSESSDRSFSLVDKNGRDYDLDYNEIAMLKRLSGRTRLICKETTNN